MGLFGMAASYLAFTVLHFFQLVLAVTVCGFYAVDLNRARNEGKYVDSKWVSPNFAVCRALLWSILPCRLLMASRQVFAEVVGALSAVTAVLYFIPFVKRFAAVFVWDFILFVLWIALFGLFGNVSGLQRSAALRHPTSTSGVSASSRGQNHADSVDRCTSRRMPKATRTSSA